MFVVGGGGFIVAKLLMVFSIYHKTKIKIFE